VKSKGGAGRGVVPLPIGGLGWTPKMFETGVVQMRFWAVLRFLCTVEVESYYRLRNAIHGCRCWVQNLGCRYSLLLYSLVYCSIL